MAAGLTNSIAHLVICRYAVPARIFTLLAAPRKLSTFNGGRRRLVSTASGQTQPGRAVIRPDQAGRRTQRAEVTASAAAAMAPRSDVPAGEDSPAWTEQPLYQPLKMGALSLRHRIIMSPMTRTRSTPPGNVPKDLNILYYTQRTSEGGLLVSEATQPSERGCGYNRSPGIYSPEQVEGWRKIVDAVHAKGGLMVAQIMHAGRVAHTSLTGGHLPLAPSPVAAPGFAHTADNKKVPFETPEEMTKEQIRGAVEEFRSAAHNAVEAGFDAIELHYANGYLPQQFLAPSVNKRTDEYGGPVENRARFPLEAIDACIEAIGADRVGIKISPGNSSTGLVETGDEVKETYAYLGAELKKRKVAYVHTSDYTTPPMSGPTPMLDFNLHAFIREVTQPLPLIVNTGFTFEGANQIIAEGGADAVSFAQAFLSNPDLVEAFKVGATLAPNPSPKTWYGPHNPEDDHIAYTDYPNRVKA